MELNSTLFPDFWVAMWGRDHDMFSVLVRENMEEFVQSFYVREPRSHLKRLEKNYHFLSQIAYLFYKTSQFMRPTEPVISTMNYVSDCFVFKHNREAASNRLHSVSIGMCQPHKPVKTMPNFDNPPPSKQADNCSYVEKS